MKEHVHLLNRKLFIENCFLSTSDSNMCSVTASHRIDEGPGPVWDTRVGEDFSEEGPNCRSIRNIIVSNNAQHIFPGGEAENFSGRAKSPCAHLSYGGEVPLRTP